MAQNFAYNIELFEAAASRTTSAAPKIRENPKPQLKVVEKPRLTASQMRAQTAAANRKAVKIVSIALVCLLFLGAVIYSTLQLDEIDREIALVDKSISIANSETVRLDMELGSIVSLNKVEEYAAQTLGMVKVQDYQVVYVDISSSDEVLMADGKETPKTEVIKSENK